MAYKQYSDSTLMSMTKPQIIEILRIAEGNYFAASETLNQHIENVKDWQPVKHASIKGRKQWDEEWGPRGDCSVCGWSNRLTAEYCNKCGARLDLGIKYDDD